MKERAKTQAELVEELAQAQQDKAKLHQQIIELEKQVYNLQQSQQTPVSNQRYFFDILNIANEAIISIDNAQQIILYNKGAERIFGYKVAEILGQPLNLLLPEALRAIHQNHIAEFAQSPTTARYMGKRQQIVGLRKNGDVFPAEASISKLQVQDGFIFTVVLRDTTNRLETERMLQHVNKKLASQAIKLEEANAELMQYAYVVSHDIRAPLRAIHNYADFLREDLADTLAEEQAAYLAGLNLAVQEAETLVEDLLTLSRIGRRSAEIEPVDLNQFLKDLVEALSLPADTTVSLAENWPTVQTEPILLRQIFQNLILNGLKFNQTSLKQVDLNWQQKIIENENRAYIEISVRDNGIGIAPEYQEQIFHVFERLHTRQEFEGTGIGLAIVRKAIRKLGGSVRLESQVGAGSTFFITLPHFAPPLEEET